MFFKLITIILISLISLSFFNYKYENDIAHISKTNKIEIHFFKERSLWFIQPQVKPRYLSLKN